MQDTIGYDVETGLFWCNSRYYNPEWGRWISPDSIEYLEPQSINGLNLYAYCNNDSVNKFDPTGHFGIFVTLLFSTIIGAAVGAGVEVVKQASSESDKWWDLRTWNWDASTWNGTKILTGALLGAATGLAFGVGGAAAGIVKGSMSAVSLFGTSLTAAQSVGLLLGTAAVTNFAAGIGAYTIESSSKGGNFDVFTGVSKGFGQLGKGMVASTLGSAFVGFGFWNVGVGATNSISSIVARIATKFLLERFPNYIFGGF